MRSVAVALLALGLTTLAVAQEESNPVKWTADAPKGPVAPGQKVDVKVNAELESGWHIYSITQPEGGPIATKISLPDGQPFKLAGKISSDAPQSHFDENFDMQVEQHEAAVTFTVPVSVTKNANGASAVKIEAMYQACTASLCLPPQTAQLSVPVALKK